MHQLDDPGTLSLVGFSAGSRSSPSFGWARNIKQSTFKDKATRQDTIEELNEDTCAAFALFWNLCRSWVPPEVIQDIDTFTLGLGLPPMAPKAQDSHSGDYHITLSNGMAISFSDVRLAPPMGLTANNYAR